MNAKLILAMLVGGLVLGGAVFTWAFSVACGWAAPTWIALSFSVAGLAVFVARAPRVFRWLSAHQRKTEELLREPKR